MFRRVLWMSVLLLAGCGGHGGGTPPAARRPAVELVPFDDTRPAALTRPAADPGPPCRASRLEVEGDGLHFVPGTADGGTGGVVLVNRGPRPCRLTGRPAVRFAGGSAPPPQRMRALKAEPLAFPALAPPAASLLALAPGKGAVLSVDWDNWCPRKPEPARLRPPKALRVTLPRGGGHLDVAYNAVVACVDAHRPSVIGVRPFTPRPLRSGRGFTDAPMTASLHRLDGGAGTLRGHRGEQLRFAVELRNASATGTVRFDRCPLVAEKFAPVGPTEPHQLNCRGVAPIPPHGTRWFEMRVRVPEDAPLGPNGLFWRLDPAGESAPQAVARVVVVE